jgi:predicted tellurium resistance membrane protein TerC
MMELLASPQAWLAFSMLTALELVLGIDNIILIAILVDELPEHQRGFARRVGLLLAMVMRVALLLAITWVMGLLNPLFYLHDTPVSGRDLILLGGGLFLIWKSTAEIHTTVSARANAASRQGPRVYSTLGRVLFQIVLIDQVFSLDSVITAVGMVEHIEIMVAAIVVAVLAMLLLAEKITAFIQQNPTLKILALSFLLMVGVALIADAFGSHIPRGYIYFAMVFSVAVEAINIRYLRNLKDMSR